MRSTVKLPAPPPHGPVHPEQGWAEVVFTGAIYVVWPLALRDALAMPEGASAAEYADRCIAHDGARPSAADVNALLALWAHLSRDPDPEPVDDGGGGFEDVTTPAERWGRVLQTLIGAGHSRRDMLEEQQDGAPYRGWSVAQARYWGRAARWARAQAQVSAAQAVADGRLLTHKETHNDAKSRLEAMAYRG